MSKKIIASEYVSYGHPDKIADQISDAILDALLEQDKNTRSGIEVMVKDNIVVLGGEVNTTAIVNYDNIVRSVYAHIPFPPNHNLSLNNIKVINLIGQQSPEINSGVILSETEIGAGDQGFVVGFASDDTKALMPLGHYLAKAICNGITTYSMYQSNSDNIFGPDCKSQVIVEYDDKRKENKVLSILVSTMHMCSLEYVREEVERLIRENRIMLDEELYNKYIKDNDELAITVNPCGSWKIGGPVSDCGVTGRKIVVDQYGGYCNVGGGAYSGKDMSKVDRSAAYMARYLAKNIVASGLCHTAKVELSYMIGVPEPSSINVDMDMNMGYRKLVIDYIKEHVDMTPYGIIKRFNGETPNYFRQVTEMGCYGYSDENLWNTLFPWEKVDFAEELSQYVRNSK